VCILLSLYLVAKNDGGILLTIVFLSTDAFLHDVDLSHNSHLAVICFENLPVFSLPSLSTINHSLLMLTQITSTDMREVAFGVWALGDPNILAMLDWDSLAHTLQQPNFSQLQKLVIFGVSDQMQESIKAWVANRLPHSSRARDLVVCRLFNKPLQIGY
jgi:hypothetical protein